MATVTKPVALDESLNTTDSTPKNIADVLKDKLGDIASAISGGGGGSGGHTIQNASGANMPQESTMQFKDSHVTDNSQADKTEVEVIKSVASADYSSETEDGLYLIPDGDGSVIEPASEDYVEVEQVTGGTKTYGELLNELRTKIDASKLTDNAVLKEINGNDRNIYNFCYQYGTSSAIQFSRASHNNGGATTVVMDFISGSYYVCVGTNRENRSSNTAPEGYKITLYYGNKKAVVDLQTTANRCLMSDGSNVEAEIIRTITLQKSDFTWDSGLKVFVSNNGAISIPSGYTAIGGVVSVTNGYAIMMVRILSNTQVGVYGILPNGQPIDSSYNFICNVFIKKY